MSDFIKGLILAVITSGVVNTVINVIHDRKKEESAKESAITKAVMFLLASSIRQECQDHINDGEIDADDLQRLEKAWGIYHNDLGGNGFLDTYMKDIKALPKKKVYK